MSARTPELARSSLLRTSLYINGQWPTGKSTFAVTDPATTAKICDVADGTLEDTKDAIKAAKAAFDKFRHTTARERSDLLRAWAKAIRDNQKDLSYILSWENGKPLAEASGEVLSSAQTFDWFAEVATTFSGDTILSQKATTRLHTIRQPVGVCGIITPWNFPMSMIARKIGAAVAAGCTGVIKPASETPLSALALAALSEDAGIPHGVVNVVPTHSHTKDVGKEICSNPVVKKITFTGSTPIGKLLMSQASSTIKKTSFELGGNASFIVFEDADIDKAVAGAMASKFRGSGQTCICANRFFIHEKVHDEFLSKFAAKVATLRPGHAFDPESTQGPLIKEQSVQKVKDHVADALAKGGKLIAGGKHPEGLSPLFFEPTIIDNCDPTTMKVFKEETFGPLAAIAKFSTEDEVIEYANSVEVGLASYFFTNDLSRSYRVSEALETGMVGINSGLITEVSLPFGGVKESGFGREMSKYGLDDYTIIKTVSTSLE